MAQDPLELVGADAEQFAVATRYDRGAPSPRRQQSHLAEQLTGTQFSHLAWTRRRGRKHPKATGHDDESAIGRIVLVDHDLARTEELALTRAGDLGQ